MRDDEENMQSTTLTIGAEQLDRIIPNADKLLDQYRDDTGWYYLEHQPFTPYDRVVIEDLAVTLLVNSQVGWRACMGLINHGSSIDLSQLPKKPLEDTSSEERMKTAEVIVKMAQIPGFAASVATKVLHKKRPDLIPILDNQAIFGAYMYPDWPGKPARGDSIKSRDTICRALNWIAFDLNRLENAESWKMLSAIEPERTRIQLFDSVWWMYFRELEPVRRSLVGGED
jgi:hypothetical protein